MVIRRESFSGGLVREPQHSGGDGRGSGGDPWVRAVTQGFHRRPVGSGGDGGFHRRPVGSGGDPRGSGGEPVLGAASPWFRPRACINRA